MIIFSGAFVINGKLLETIMIRRGITQTEFAGLLGIKQNYLSMLISEKQPS